MYTRPDLHLHSCFSDGTDTPEQLFEKVRSCGIDAFSLTDHNVFGGCRRMLEIVPDDICFVAGAEFSVRDEYGKYHLLGYGFDLDNAEINAISIRSHNIAVSKLNGRIEFLKNVYGWTFTRDEIAWAESQSNPGKPHIVELMKKHGYGEGQNLYHLLNGYPETETQLEPEMVIRAIKAAGGIPVLAHAFFGDGDYDLSDDETLSRIARFKEYGLMGVEAWYSGFSAAQTAKLLYWAGRYDLVCTCGSDYHGARKRVGAGDTGNPVPELIAPFFDLLNR